MTSNYAERDWNHHIDNGDWDHAATITPEAIQEAIDVQELSQRMAAYTRVYLDPSSPLYQQPLESEV